jgi:hypothetical protein
LRRLRRSLERPPVLYHEAGSLEIIDELHRWVLGLPWVVELPLPPAELSGHRFVVECPPLGRRVAWMLLAPVGELGFALDLHVVLPQHIARRGVAMGWAVPITHVDTDREAVGVALPTTTTELCALQRLLLVAYTAAFSAFASPAPS